MTPAVPLPEAAIGSLMAPLQAALDARHIAALVEAHLQPPAGVAACQPAYLRFKADDGALVGWHLSLLDGTTTHVTVRLAPVTRLRQEAERFAARWSDKLAFRGLRPLALVDDPPLLLLAFPLDRTLARLDALLDVRAVRRMVATQAPELMEGGARISKSRSQVQVVRYKPERRAVLCWRLCLSGAGARDVERDLFVRMHSQPRAQQARAGARAAQQSGVRCVTPFTPANEHLALEPRLPGTPLELNPGWDSRGLPSAAREAVRAAGEMLSRMHRAPTIPGLRAWQPGQELSAVAQVADALSALDEELGQRAAAVVGQLSAGHALLQALLTQAPTVLHGDFHSGQLLYDGELPGLVDFDRVAVGHPAYDLASFQAQLSRAGFSPGTTRSLMSELEAGYARGRSLPDSRAQSWFTACALVRLAMAPFRALQPDWPRRAHELLGQAEALCVALDARAPVPGALTAARPAAGPLPPPTLVEVMRDAALPGRGLACEGAPIRERLSAVLAEVRTVQAVAHRPGRRAVLRVDGTDALGKVRTLYVKLFPPQAWWRATRTYDALPLAHGSVRLALPVLRDEALAATITPAAAGRSLHERLLAGEEIPVLQLAAALRRLRRFPTAGGLPRHTLEDERASTLRMLRLAVEVGTPDAASLSALARQVEALPLPADTAEDVLHRDLHDKQIYLDGTALELTTLIDLEMVSVGDARIDAVNLAEHLRLRALQHPTASWARSAESASRFLLHQLEIDPEDPTVRTLTALTVARLAGVYAQRPGWGDLWTRLRLRAQRLLATGRDTAALGLCAVALAAGLLTFPFAGWATAGAPEYSKLRPGDGISIELLVSPTPGAALVADEIEELAQARKPKLRGVLEAVDASARSVTVLGVAIAVPAAAVWDGGDADAFLAQARAGQWVEIKCLGSGGDAGAGTVIQGASTVTDPWTAEEIQSAQVKQSPKLKGVVARLVSDGLAPDTLYVEDLPVVLLPQTDLLEAQEDVVAEEFFGRGEDEDGMAAGVRRTLPVARGLTVWGSYRQSTRMERGYNLAGAPLDELDSTEPSLRAQGVLQLSAHAELHAQVRALRPVLLQDTPARSQLQPFDDQFDVTVREAYLSVADLGGLGVGFTLGKQRLRDQRELFFDEYLDAARLVIHRARPLVLEASFLPSVAPLKDKFETWDDLLLRAHLFAGKDHTATAFLLDRQDQSARNREPRYVGASYHGEPARWVEAWATGALLRGTDKGQRLRAWMLDVAVTARARHLGLRPSASIGYAHGSGDDLPDDGVSNTFRQSGYEDNSGRFEGISNFQLYGEVFQPELANLKVWTVAAGVRPTPDVSIDVVGHIYRQHRLADALEGSDLLAPPVEPTGLLADLGRELDVIVGAQRLWQRLNLAYAFGWLDPGEGFGPRAQTATLHRVELRVDF